jgi:hypothetical protein
MGSVRDAGPILILHRGTERPIRPRGPRHHPSSCCARFVQWKEPTPRAKPQAEPSTRQSFPAKPRSSAGSQLRHERSLQEAARIYTLLYLPFFPSSEQRNRAKQPYPHCVTLPRFIILAPPAPDPSPQVQSLGFRSIPAAPASTSPGSNGAALPGGRAV